MEILANFSSKALYRVTFDKNWFFTFEGLKSFFENWKGRITIKFYHYVYDSNYFTKEHVKLLKKYFNEDGNDYIVLFDKGY